LLAYWERRNLYLWGLPRIVLSTLPMLLSRSSRSAVSLCVIGALLLPHALPLAARASACQQSAAGVSTCTGCGSCRVAESIGRCRCCCSTTPKSHNPARLVSSRGCCGSKAVQQSSRSAVSGASPVKELEAGICLCGKGPAPAPPVPDSRTAAELLITLPGNGPALGVASLHPPVSRQLCSRSAPPESIRHPVQRLLCIWLI
jgi:hypothetical protein